MVFNTITVGAAVTPTVIETWLSHYLNRKPLKEKPTAHISYHLGLQLVRQFIVYASQHTVEDIQAFTSQWVPNPRWVRVENTSIPALHIKEAAKLLREELGAKGIEAVGGSRWWQWRPEDCPLKAEWLEMRKDYNARKDAGAECRRCMLYVHGGAYYFGSVDEHRYQIQRHARKLQARVLCPRYRLAPQYPFPCGLLDCLAAYLFLLSVQPPETIILAGDSAGGGMLVSLMVILRDQGIPLPAGAILISPWVDLTHSFPSVTGWNEMDYVPPHGFAHRPCTAWPPPSADEMETLKGLASKDKADQRQPPHATATAKIGSNEHSLESLGDSTYDVATREGPRDTSTPYLPNLTVTIDDTAVEIKDQIQIYASNALISHPLVSPILQPSLGGLPPLLILVGGGEMLRDEQIYLAEKAAHPAKYPPSKAYLTAQGPHAAELVTKWPPTNVQLQVWEDLCHVAPTLSFTRPAKYMYRSVAQFGAWCLARAQQTEIEIVDDDDISVISSNSYSSFSSSSINPSNPPVHTATSNGVPIHRNPHDHSTHHNAAGSSTTSLSHPPTANATAHAIGTAGAPLPPFSAHMIRQRVTRHGITHPLAPAHTLPACQMRPEDIGTIKPGPVRKWLEVQALYAKRYTKERRRVHETRIKELRDAAVRGVGGREQLFPGERPPRTAMAWRVQVLGVESVPKTKHGAAKKTGFAGFGLKMWSGWGSKHDEVALEKEEQMDRDEEKEVRRASVVAATALVPGPGQMSVVEEALEETDAKELELNPRGSGSGGGAGLLSAASAWGRRRSRSRSRSRSRPRARKRSVAYEGQIEDDLSAPHVQPVHDEVQMRKHHQSQEEQWEYPYYHEQPQNNLHPAVAPLTLPPVIAISASFPDSHLPLGTEMAGPDRS